MKKPGKLKIVHDAAAQTHGVSLNSLLISGPDLLQALLEIMMKFPEGQVALPGNITLMFPLTEMLTKRQTLRDLMKVFDYIPLLHRRRIFFKGFGS